MRSSLVRAFAARNEKGVTTVEWVGIAALLFVVVAAGFTALSGGINGAITNILNLF